MRTMSYQQQKSRAARIALAVCCGLAVAHGAHATQQRDFLVGPVTLGPGDSMLVTVANVAAAPRCLEPARIEFVEHEMGEGPAASRDLAEVAVGDILRKELGTAQLAPGKSAKLRIRGAGRSATATVQVHVATERLVLGVDPCINIGGTVLRSNGRAEAVAGVQFADDFSIELPTSEAVCFGRASCDELLELCEASADCSFTCHIAIPDPDEQACVFGSTD
jgi:hypothetical protein